MSEPDREQRLQRLEDALEVFLGRDATRSDADLLAQHPELSDLLEPMLGPAAPGDAEPPGRRIGDLQLTREIGRGGMGVVYEAEDVVLKRRVAVKVMPRTALTTPSAIVRFRREAELAANLQHPAMVPVHALGEQADAFYLVMALAKAASLADVIAELRDAPPGTPFGEVLRAAIARRFPEAAAEPPPDLPPRVPAMVDLLTQVADALAAAHRQGVLHRDVKPGNILVDLQGRAFLTDFGLACVQGDPAVTQTGQVPGTPQYMAPEQARGDRQGLGPHTDVWALGATLYEALTLQRAFPGESTPAVLAAIAHTDPADASRVAPDVPRDLAAILAKALEKPPHARYPAAAAFAADLRACRAGEPVVARPIGRLGRWRRRLQREPARAALLGVLLLGTPLGSWIAWQASQQAELAGAGERLRDAAWFDLQLANGFREAGEGDREAARDHFAALLARHPGAEEGIAGLSVVARRTADDRAIATLLAHPGPLAASQALRRRLAMLLERNRRTNELPPGAPIEPLPVGFDAFLDGFGHLELGHRGETAAFAVAAKRLQRAVLTSDHPRPVYYFEWLHAAVHAGDLEAVSAARAAIARLWGDLAASWFWIAFAQDRAGDAAGAIASLQRAEALDPAFLGASINHARLLRQAGRHADSVTRLERLLPAATHPALVRYELGATLLQAGQAERALPHLAAALADRPMEHSWRRLHASALAAANRAAAAIVAFGDYLRDVPHDHEARQALAGLLLKGGRHQEARQHLAAVVAGRPTAAACYSLGIACNALEDLAAARAAYEQALALEPGHLQSAVNLALLLTRAGEPTEAERRLRQALAHDPTFVPARRALLRALDARPADAVAMCREWCAAAADFPEARRHLAASLLATGATEHRAEALALARGVVDAEPKDAPAWHVLGTALLASGDASAARTAIQQALDLLDPQDRFTSYYRPRFLATLEQCDAALRARR